MSADPDKCWTNGELRKLRRLYGTQSSITLAAQFPGRSPMALRVMATRMGLSHSGRRRPHAWTAAQQDVLIAEIRAAHKKGRRKRLVSVSRKIGVPLSSVRAKVRQLINCLDEFAALRPA